MNTHHEFTFDEAIQAASKIQLQSEMCFSLSLQKQNQIYFQFLFTHSSRDWKISNDVDFIYRFEYNGCGGGKCQR